MNKFAALLAAGMLLSGCVYNSKVSTGAEQLQHHRFVLTSVNGQAVNASDRPLELSFGEKMAITGKMYVSGNMCNGFSGEGKVSDGELKVKSLAMTRMLCHDAQLNTLDATIGKMLREGAQVDLTENQLTLATADQTLPRDGAAVSSRSCRPPAPARCSVCRSAARTCQSPNHRADEPPITSRLSWRSWPDRRRSSPPAFPA
ncbi:Heat shock protein hslJ [Klebsiella pneumoniae]|nr:Heat shock protein hslJ [Klebsiella pneumoniae]